MIVSFRDRKTEQIFMGTYARGIAPVVQERARQKLRMLDSAITINDLRSPPANRLERLKGNRQGQYSIRINKQWRICFVWLQSNAYNVEVTDYH
jgi:proteic killer suppression protein